MEPKIVAIALLGLMFVGMGYQAYELNQLRTVPAAELLAGSDWTVGTTGNTQRKAPSSMSQMARWNLLGNPEAAPVVEKVEVPDTLPETKLKLTLLGTINNSDDGVDSALIKDGNKIERFYVNDKLQGGVVLHAVRDDSVVLKRGERLETLRYPDAAPTDASSQSRSPARNAAGEENAENNQQRNNKKLTSLKDRLKRAAANKGSE